jgi:gas vesicle structural protein
MFDSIHCTLYGPLVVVAETIRTEIISIIEGERQLRWFPRSSPAFAAQLLPPPPRLLGGQAVERLPSRGYLDILDRVLDKGIVIDAWMRVASGGIDLVEVEARVIVASIETYLTHAKPLVGVRLLSPPRSALAPKRKPAA